MTKSTKNDLFSPNNYLPVLLAFASWAGMYLLMLWIVGSNPSWFESPDPWARMTLYGLLAMRVFAPIAGAFIGTWIAEIPERRKANERYQAVQRRIRARAARTRARRRNRAYTRD